MGTKVVVVFSGVGKINAAIAAQILACRYRPFIFLCTITDTQAECGVENFGINCAKAFEIAKNKAQELIKN